MDVRNMASLPRGSYAKGRQRRDEILATALRELSMNGYRHTSLRAIGRALGVQPAHLLHYFDSKERLLEEILTASDRETERLIVASPTGFLDVWPEVVRRNSMVPGLVHLYTAFAAEATDDRHPSRPYFQRRLDLVRQRVESNIIQLQADGRVRAVVDPRRAATQLIALSDGLQLQWLIDPSLDMAAELTAAIDDLRTA
jgi:AcrR family transcriptional regulator